MSRSQYIGGGGAPATVTKIFGSSWTGVVLPPSSFIGLNIPALGPASPTRRIFLLASGTGLHAASLTNILFGGVGGDPPDHWEIRGVRNVIASRLLPAGTGSYTIRMLFNESSVQNFSSWVFSTTNIRTPIPLDYDERTDISVGSGAYPMSVNARRGGLVFGGAHTGPASAVSIANMDHSEEEWHSTNRHWGFWDDPLTSTQIKNMSINITSTGDTVTAAALWSFR